MASKVGEAWQQAFNSNIPALSGETIRYIEKFRTSEIWAYISSFCSLTPESLTLEAGCGSAKLSLAFAVLGFKVTALDYSPIVLRAGKNNLKQAENIFNKRLKVSFVQDNLENLSLAPNQFDLVFNEGVVEHWLNDEERLNVLKQMVRAAKPKGAVVVIVPNGSHPLTPWWEKKCEAFYAAPPMTYYSAEKLKQELELAGLSNVKVDGLYPWRTIDFYSQKKLNKYIGFLLQHSLPLPLKLRQKFGIHLIGLGKKA